MLDRTPSLAFSKMEAGLNEALGLAKHQVATTETFNGPNDNILGEANPEIVASLPFVSMSGPTDRELFEIEAGNQAGCVICGQIGDCA
jgi:hypothetical protein